MFVCLFVCLFVFVFVFFFLVNIYHVGLLICLRQFCDIFKIKLLVIPLPTTCVSDRDIYVNKQMNLMNLNELTKYIFSQLN